MRGSARCLQAPSRRLGPRAALVAGLVLVCGVAFAQAPGGTTAPPPDDLGATGLGEPAGGAEPAPGPEPPPAPPPPAAPPPVSADRQALMQIFAQAPMYQAGLASIVQRPPGAAETAAIPEALVDRDAFARLTGDMRRYMDGFAFDWYRRRERDVQRSFRQASSVELDLQRRSRRAAIYYLERFVADHAGSRAYTPDAMYRLGDLYWEDENETAALAGRQRMFTKTIDLYKRLLDQYPDYERRDGVYYVLGFSLQETPSAAFLSEDLPVGMALQTDPNLEEAVASFLAAVCANKVAYPPFRGAIAGPRRVDGSPQWFIPPPPPPPEPVRGGRGAPPPPVEASDEFRDLADPNTVMRDYFKECRPLNPRSQFLAPTWFVLGKHFHGRYAREFNDENMEWAISAFRRVVELGPQGNPYYAFALAEIGHALSAMNRYDEGMGPYLLFLQKLQAGEFGEYQSKAEGQRTNVLNGIATNLIYNYWMGPRAQQDPATRAADPTVIPQDAEWFQALMETLVEECCEPPSDRCDTWQKKVGVYRLFIQRFPLHPKVPQMLRKLVDLFRENAAEGDQAGRQGLLEAIECLALFRRSGGAGAGAGGAAPVIAAGHANSLCPDPTVGQRWWEENRDNPELIEEAEQEAEGALQDAAGQYHAAAQTHQANCDAGVEESCALATRMYELAVEAYRRLIQEYPQSAFTYDNMFNLAGCFYSIGRIDEAFEQFQAVEASTLSNVYQRDALFNQVAILSNEFRETGNTLIPEQAPSHEVTQQTPDGEVTLTVPDPVEPLPPLVANLHAVMTRWIERYPDDPASLGYRRMIASQLYFLAHWDRAEATYEQLFQEYCPNPAQAELAMDAYQILDTLANFRQDRERIEQLREWQTGECFSASETGQTIRDRTRDQVIGEQFFAASQRFLRAGDAADPAAEYRGAARDLLEVVAQNLDSPNSPAAIRMAAIAYSRAEEPVRAVETWSQLIQHCSPPSPHVERCARATEPGNRVSLPEAHFYVAIYAMQTFDLDEARRSFQALERSAGRPVRGERLRKVEECINDERRPCTDAEYTAEAVRNIAGISRLQGSYPEAARLTERMLSEGYTRSTEEATRLRLDVVQLYNEGSAWNDMRRAADEYLRTFESDRARRFDVLRVRWILYKDAERQRDRRAMDRASTMLETAYNRLSAEEKAIVPAGLDAAKGQLVINVQEILARPRFEAFDGKFREFERVQFEPRSLRQLVNDVKTYKDNLIRLSRELTAGYVTVIRDFPVSPTWGVAARYRISYVWNNLAYRMATMGQRMRTEWLELVVNDQTGETLSDLLDTVASEIRGVEAEPGTGITIEMIIRWYLIGDGSAEVQGVVGAVPYARSTGGTNEWSRQAIQLVQQLSLSQDPTQLFANGRLPEVTGEALGGGLDPVAQ